MVERHLAKVDVDGSNPFTRSTPEPSAALRRGPRRVAGERFTADIVDVEVDVARSDRMVVSRPVGERKGLLNPRSSVKFSKDSMARLK